MTCLMRGTVGDILRTDDGAALFAATAASAQEQFMPVLPTILANHMDGGDRPLPER